MSINFKKCQEKTNKPKTLTQDPKTSRLLNPKTINLAVPEPFLIFRRESRFSRDPSNGGAHVLPYLELHVVVGLVVAAQVEIESKR
jgi:hypothetical protein